MAETPSTMLPLGTPAPPLRLADAVTGRVVDAAEAARGKKGLLVAFICNHCPFVKRHPQGARPRGARRARRGVRRGGRELQRREGLPAGRPGGLRQLASEEGWRFPFLFDETQEVAKAFRAACTPDLFLFDGGLRLAYRGQFDDSRPSKDTPITGASLSAAIEAVAAGRPPAAEQKPSVGCNIKWKPGNAPPSFG